MKNSKISHLFNIIVFTILCYLAVTFPSFSQDYIFDTEIINVEEGLPHRMVYAVVQDKKGFIWISTQGAISRYDGYGFKTYNTGFLKIGQSMASHLAIDAANRLWYCSEDSNTFTSGVIDTAKDSIYAMESISKGRFTAKDVVYLSNSDTAADVIFIATRSGMIYTYNGKDFEEVYRFPHPVSNLLACKADPDGSHWIIHKQNIINVKGGNVLKKLHTGEMVKRIVSAYPELVVEMYNPVSGIKYRKLENDSLLPFTIPPHDPEAIKGIFQLHQDYSCYAIKGALLIQDTQGTLRYSFDALDPAGDFSRPKPDVMLYDRQQLLWIATDNGLIKLRAKKNPFEILLPGDGFRGVFKDHETLWVGGGRYQDSVPDGVRLEQEYLEVNKEDAMSFYKDLQGHIWMSISGDRLVSYDPDKDSYTHYDFGTVDHIFFLIFQHPVTKNYWVSSSHGLYRVDIANKKLMPFPLLIPSESVKIGHRHQNAQGIWLSSDKGIFLMDIQEEVILKHYTTADGLPSNSITHIHEDSEGIFWMGTRDAGLIRWDRESNSFRQYTRENELSNNTIYAVYEDDFETLWLPSDYGLMAFDKATETVKVYLPKDGIAHEEFNAFSHFQDKDGTLYFGGLNGITKFHPAALRENSSAVPPLYITRVRLLEKDAELFTDKTTAYNAAKKIILNPNDRILELELTLLDYEKSSENQYAYRLRGKQEQWLYTRENKLSIINPPYGKYDLEIKARGASGQWSEHPLVIPMNVKLPFYRQWWFILISALFGIASILAGVRWRVQKLEKDRSRLETEVQKRTHTIAEQAEALKALDKAKTRFFANITHEFRTPLTLIAGPAEQLIAKKPPEPFKKGLYGILKHTRGLSELINQLLDLSKLEGDQMKTEISRGDIVRYTEELIARFQPLAGKKQLQLELTNDPELWETHFDTDKWNKLVYNLLSNAIKFTPEGGTITVHLEQLQQADREYIQLKVKDTGIGIEKEYLDYIFDRFYQVDASSTRVRGGTGIGLALVKELVELQNGTILVNSTPGKGTLFTVMLPVMPEFDTQAPELPLIPGDMLPMSVDSLLMENEQTLHDTDTKEAASEKLELLIIEDHGEMRAYIRSCIDTSIYTISEAADGETGIAKAREIIPDLIISDIMMPKKDGFEVTRAIRDHRATSHIPLILLTAKAALESRLKGLERGADAYLTKPFSPQELALRIKKLIELRRLLQTRYQNDEIPPADAAFEKEDTFITDLKTHIRENMSEPDLNTSAIGSHFAMSRMQLHRKIKSLTGNSTHYYIRSVRLHTAMELLKEKRLTITEIAYETGFSSPENFTRAFRKVFGKAPSKI